MRSPDPADPALDRAMSVRLVSISGRASAEQFGFRGGRAWRTIAHFPGVVGSLGEDGGQFAAGVGREVGERGNRSARPGVPWANWVTGSCGSARLITRFPPRCSSAASSSRPSACRSRASRVPGNVAACHGAGEEDGHEPERGLQASGGSSTPPWRRTRHRSGALRRPQRRRPPGPGDVPYERSPP